MRFGVHVGIGTGWVKAADFASDSTCDCIQIFSSNPTGWRPSPLDERQAAAFAKVAAERDLRPVFLHTPYLINLASSRPDFHEKSIALLENAIGKAGRLAALGVPGSQYVVTHVGSHQGLGVGEGCRRIGEAIMPLLAAAPEGARLLIENSPGSGTELAHTFEEYALILEPLEKFRDVLGVTLDTAHLWGAGYDIGTAEGVRSTLGEFDRLVGLDRLTLIHANDSIYGLGSRNDEHVHPGDGKIGLECFRALMSDRRLDHVCFVQEYPGATAEENRHLLDLLRDMVPR